MSYNLAGAQAMQGTRGRPEDLMNTLASQEREPSLTSKLEQTRRRLEGVAEAVDMLRSKLEPVLLQEVDSSKPRGETPANPGSPAMQALDCLHDQIDRLHAAVNDLMRRSAV